MLLEKLCRQIINMYLLAGVDGDYDEQELLAISAKAKEANLSLDELQEVLNKAAQYRNATLPDSLEERVRELYELALIVWSDGIIKDEEREMLSDFVRQYGFAEDNVTEIVNYLISQAQAGTTIETILAELTLNEA